MMNILITILSSILALQAIAGEKPKTPPVILDFDIKNRPAVTYLIENTECDLVNAKTFGESLQDWQDAISALSAVHWYLALSIENEASSVQVCKAYLPLEEIPSEEAAGLSIFYKDSKQISVRVGNRIYFDMNLMAKTNRRDQTYIHLHQLLHGFIPLNAKNRIQKVYSMMMALHQNTVERYSRENFAIQLRTSEMQIVETTDKLDPYRKQVEIALTPKASTDTRQYVSKALLGSGAKLMRKNDFAVVQQLYKELNERVQVAAKKNDHYAVLDGIKLGAEPNMLVNGTTPLVVWATQKAHYALLEKLLSLDELDVNAAPTDQATNGPTALAEAVIKKDFYMIKLLLGVKSTDRNLSFMWFDKDGLTHIDTPLSYATQAGDTFVVKTLINPAQQIEINKPQEQAPDTLERTPLFLAVINRDVETAKLLLNHPKIEVNTTSSPYRKDATSPWIATPLSLAAFTGDVEMIKALQTNQQLDINIGHIGERKPLCTAMKSPKWQAAVLIGSDSRLNMSSALDVCSVRRVTRTRWTSVKPIEETWEERLSPLAIAINKSDLPLVQAIMKNAKLSPKTIVETAGRCVLDCSKDDEQLSALEYAAYQARWSIYKALKAMK